MNDERRLAKFVHGLQRQDIPSEVATIVRRILLAVAGTTVAGAAEDGCGQLRAMLCNRGGRPEATVLIYGDRIPAASAAQINAVMARALDFCDATSPGLHIGSSLIPAALAAAELKGGCTGCEFLTALTAGAEVASRLNLSKEAYDGFDPTGIAGIFGATAAAARILALNEEEILHALALAFNRCAGSFQSNVDGAMAVRLIQGWVAESAISCAQLAQHGFTGPANFLSGIYGYWHLYAKDMPDAQALDALGETYALKNTMFKRYPSCGCTQAATEVAVQVAIEANLLSEQIRSVEIRVPPYAYRLVGKDFAIGNNPRVDAQFSAQYCVASALVRQSSKLAHFRAEEVQEPAVIALVGRVKVVPDISLETRGHTAADISLVTSDGRTYRKSIDIAPGYPGNPLRDEEHLVRFNDCMNFSRIPLTHDHVQALVDAIASVDELPDARILARLLTA